MGIAQKIEPRRVEIGYLSHLTVGKAVEQRVDISNLIAPRHCDSMTPLMRLR